MARIAEPAGGHLSPHSRDCGSSQLAIRRLGPTDRSQIERGLSQLSERSLWSRFGKPVQPSDGELAWITELGRERRVAFGACEAATRAPVGLARYVRAEAGCAEVAVTITDIWQRRGIGTLLLNVLIAHARTHDPAITAVTAEINAANRAAMQLMRAIGGRPVGGPSYGLILMRALI